MRKLNTTKFDKQDIILQPGHLIAIMAAWLYVIVLDITSSKIDPAQTEVVWTSTWILHTYSLET